MKTTLVTMSLAAGLGLSTAAVAASDPAIEAPINAFMAAFNKGDTKGASAAYMADVTIIDEVPPYKWTGPGAFEAWVADLGKDDKADGISGEAVSLLTPTRVLVTGSTAYVVAPSTYSFTQKGTAMTEVAQMTFSLKKTAAGWKIAGWTWTGPNASPVR